MMRPPWTLDGHPRSKRWKRPPCRDQQNHKSRSTSSCNCGDDILNQSNECRPPSWTARRLTGAHAERDESPEKRREEASLSHGEEVVESGRCLAASAQSPISQRFRATIFVCFSISLSLFSPLPHSPPALSHKGTGLSSLVSRTRRHERKAASVSGVSSSAHGCTPPLKAPNAPETDAASRK